MPKESKKSQITHQEHTGDFIWGHCSLQFCSSRPHSLPALLVGGFTMTETGSLMKLSKTLAESGLGDSLHQCASLRCFVSTIFGCQKHACGPHLYLPNMTPCELFLLPWIKSQLQGHHFHNVPEVQIYSPTTLHSILKSHFQKWQKHQTHCINLERDYKKKTKPPMTNNKY